jgi:sulfhydrogenase subunit delta
VCVECKQRGTVCVMVQGIPCLGPVTHAGCGAICPSYRRGCYGCYGPMETPNTAALAREWQALGATPRDIRRVFRTFNAAAEPFRKEGEAHGD